SRYLPGRGILWSILVHSIVIYGLLFTSLSAGVTEAKRPRFRVTMVNLKDPNYRLYLPVLLGANAPTSTQADAGSEVLEKKPNIPLADRKKSSTYPGPQPIVSDVPNPTNSIQTILQPAMKDPPILPPPLILPNIVQLPDVVSPPTMATPT